MVARALLLPTGMSEEARDRQLQMRPLRESARQAHRLAERDELIGVAVNQMHAGLHVREPGCGVEPGMEVEGASCQQTGQLGGRLPILRQPPGRRGEELPETPGEAFEVE